MSNPGDADSTPITSVRQLADYIAVGCKPPARFRIGTEHEKFGFRLPDLTPPPYLPADGHPGAIHDLLESLRQTSGEPSADNGPILDHGNLIGLRQHDASVSLEPAGQLELSGAPLATLHDTKAELEAHFAQLRCPSRDLRIGFAPLGFHPLATRAAMPWMPKSRYAIMRRYMPTVGTLGLDMMTRTCTVQVNLDYASEADMRRKLRVSLLLQPLATALFANSPFTEGQPNGFQSYRAHVWTDTDNQRSGIPAVFFEDGFGFERYAEWLLDDLPMYFVYRDGTYIDVAGQSFRAFMGGGPVGSAGAGPTGAGPTGSGSAGSGPAGSGPAGADLAHIVPTIGDFADHMTTAFTDVRLKRFLEMRGADAGSAEMMLAQSALWVGLLYDDAALAAAEALVRGLGHADALALRAAVPKQGIAAPFRGGTLRDLARDVVAIARDGLRARGCRDSAGADETAYLAPLEAIAAGGPTQAEYWMARYRGDWHGDVRRIFAEAAI